MKKVYLLQNIYEFLLLIILLKNSLALETTELIFIIAISKAIIGMPTPKLNKILATRGDVTYIY